MTIAAIRCLRPLIIRDLRKRLMMIARENAPDRRINGQYQLWQLLPPWRPQLTQRSFWTSRQQPATIIQEAKLSRGLADADQAIDPRHGHRP